MKVIGQTNLLNTINAYNLESCPRFLLVVGDSGCGKHVIADYISDHLNIITVDTTNAVADVRNIVTEAYIQTEPTLYRFFDIDNMSVQAKNSILKITEEPPRLSYFCMTACNKDNVLPTILSRATVLTIEPYTYSDILEFIDVFGLKLSENNKKILSEIVTNPQHLNLISQYGFKSFLDYCYKIADNISEYDGPEAFKLFNKVTDKTNPYDTILVLNTLSHIFFEKYLGSGNIGYKNCISLISKYKGQLNISSVNKSYLLDSLLLDIRQEI